MVMAEDASLLTKRGVLTLQRLALAIILSSLFIAGYWMLSQTLNAVVIFGRDYVDIPSFPLPVSVWPYHDMAYALLWISYVGFVLWDILPWRRGHLTAARTVVALIGFSILTAGLWLAQDTMNAVLVLGRAFVDYPFLLVRFDVYESMNVASLLVALGFIGYFGLRMVAGKASS